MQHFTNSDYALNKYSEGIVYRFADGIVEVTLADYIAENPGKSKADFLALKELSDGIYYTQDRAYSAQTKKNTPIDGVDEFLLCLVPSAEEIVFDVVDAIAESEQRQEQLNIVDCVLDKLTEVQRRRYLMHRLEGKTTREIAAAEGCSQQSVVECLAGADKKIKKFLSKP
jgi:RNA polymerase sigma factor (sigma-70 family)